MVEARVQLLQRMPIFGGISADVLEFLLTFCTVVSVPADQFFFREDDQGDSLFVLETGEAAVLNPGTERITSSNALELGIASGRWR
jgi:CRP/FNR family cyclic AMP-dependent transcriptional regulator